VEKYVDKKKKSLEPHHRKGEKAGLGEKYQNSAVRAVRATPYGSEEQDRRKKHLGNYIFN